MPRRPGAVSVALAADRGVPPAVFKAILRTCVHCGISLRIHKRTNPFVVSKATYFSAPACQHTATPYHE
eukprot:5778749-Prymnesium_polylepis.1